VTGICKRLQMPSQLMGADGKQQHTLTPATTPSWHRHGARWMHL
jgi:hypothetical protein